MASLSNTEATLHHHCDVINYIIQIKYRFE